MDYVSQREIDYFRENPSEPETVYSTAILKVAGEFEGTRFDSIDLDLRAQDWQGDISRVCGNIYLMLDDDANNEFVIRNDDAVLYRLENYLQENFQQSILKTFRG
jgi:hypothetical protein